MRKVNLKFSVKDRADMKKVAKVMTSDYPSFFFDSEGIFAVEGTIKDFMDIEGILILMDVKFNWLIGWSDFYPVN